MWAGLPREERLDLFRRAVSLDPSNSRGMLAFVELLEWDNTTRDNRDWREGEEMIARIQAIDPLGPRVRFWVVQRQLGKLTPDQIEQEQLKVLQLDPQNYPMANRYAMRRWRVHGDTAQAIALMEKVIASDPQNPWGPHGATAFYLDVGDLAAAQAVAATTPASRDSTRPMLDQYRGDWHGAAQAALGPRGFLFNQFENYLWAESVRDDALHGGDYLHAAEAIAARYGFDLANPRPTNLQQTEPALSLAQLLMLGGRQEDAKRLLVENLQWLDSRPAFGLNGGNGRSKAGSLMLLGQRDQALSVLRASVESGFDCRHWWYLAERDPVWAPVHADPRFGDIIGLCRQRAEAERAKLDLMRRQGKVPVRSGGR
jgi:hypothetical protein